MADLLVRYRQALAALGAAPGEDLAAVLRAHPLAETVRLLAAAVVGLERALRQNVSPSGTACAGEGPVDPEIQPGIGLVGWGTGQASSRHCHATMRPDPGVVTLHWVLGGDSRNGA